MHRPPRSLWDLFVRLAPLLAAALGLGCHPPLARETAEHPAAAPDAVAAQQPVRTAAADPWAHEQSDLPADPRIHYGALPNGMRWAWASHPEPQDRVYLRLHVDVGSLAETEAERGMAHFLEHMAFNGTENFAAGTMVEWFQEQGMAFGADTNAHTSFSETVYKLDLPETDEQTLREGLQVLRDFAGGMLLAAEEVEAEKGVIDGEERERDSAGFRAFLELLEQQYAGTRYPERLPIGTKPARDGFTAETVRAFYARWYRPENMSLVIVGDLGERDPSGLIAEYFASLPVPEAAREREPEVGAPTLATPFVAVQNEELPTMQLNLSRVRVEPAPDDSQAERLGSLRRRVAQAILNLRFQELVKKPDTPFLAASVGSAGQFDLLRGGSLDVVATPELYAEALEEAYVELRRALNFGFRPEELEEVRAEWLRGIDEAVEREATAPSAGLREAILLEIEEGVVPTAAAFDRDLLRPALEALTIEDCLAAFREEWRGGTLLMSCVGPRALEDAEQTLSAIEAAGRARPVERAAEVEAQNWAYATGELEPVEPAAVESEDDLGLIKVRYPNGVLLNIKATDFREREVLVSLRAGRGTLALPPNRPDLAALAAPLFSGGGLEAHDADQIRRLMAGRNVGVGFAIADDAFQVGGATTAEDLGLQLEWMRATLEHPGWRPDLVPLIRAQIPLIYEQFRHTADGPLVLEFTPALLQGDSRAGWSGFARFATQEQLLALEMADVRAALEGPLAEGPLELTIVGDIDVDAVIEVVGQVFGTMDEREVPLLPAVMPQASLATGVEMSREVATEDEKASLTMVFPTTDGLDTRVRRHLSFLGTVVDDRLRVHVREELGAAYSPSASAESSSVWLGLGGVVLQAAGEPAEAEALRAACTEAVAQLAAEGVQADELSRLQAPILKQLRDAQRTNAYWHRILAEAQTNPASLADARSVLRDYEELDRELLNELAARYLAPERASWLLVLPAAD